MVSILDKVITIGLVISAAITLWAVTIGDFALYVG
jgi:hypothetical protein